MRINTIIISAAVLVVFVALGLAWINPSVTQYRIHILTAAAQQEADRISAAEQQAIEREARLLNTHLAAVHYEGSRLDRAMIQRRYPLLGASLVDTNVEESLHERVARVKEQALRRVALTRETILYHTLADLTAHTQRRSYGLWSEYVTCYQNIRLAYLGIGGHFYESNAVPCPPSPRI